MEFRPFGVQIQYPCAACKSLRRRCSENCILAPYFPSSEPLRFAIVHRVFGASNVIRRLQEIREEQRADAVNSMVYEADARIRDPVYGCAGVVSYLHNRNLMLQQELANAQAQIANLASLIEMHILPSHHNYNLINNNVSELQGNWSHHGLSVEPFWTPDQHAVAPRADFLSHF